MQIHAADPKSRAHSDPLSSPIPIVVGNCSSSQIPNSQSTPIAAAHTLSRRSAPSSHSRGSWRRGGRARCSTLIPEASAFAVEDLGALAIPVVNTLSKIGSVAHSPEQDHVLAAELGNIRSGTRSPEQDEVPAEFRNRSPAGDTRCIEERVRWLATPSSPQLSLSWPPLSLIQQQVQQEGQRHPHQSRPRMEMVSMSAELDLHYQIFLFLPAFFSIHVLNCYRKKYQ